MYTSWSECAPDRKFCKAWKLVVPFGRSTATSPSRMARSTGKRPAASVTVGKLAVQSRPFRLARVTRPWSIRARMR